MWRLGVLAGSAGSTLTKLKLKTIMDHLPVKLHKTIGSKHSQNTRNYHADVNYEHLKNETICQTFFSMPTTRKWSKSISFCFLVKSSVILTIECPQNYSLLKFDKNSDQEAFCTKNKRAIVEILVWLLSHDANKSGYLCTWYSYTIDEIHWHRLIKKCRIIQDVDEFDAPTPPSLSYPPVLLRHKM